MRQTVRFWQWQNATDSEGFNNCIEVGKGYHEVKSQRRCNALDIKVLTIEFGSKLWSFNKDILYAVDSMDLFMDV